MCGSILNSYFFSWTLFWFSRGSFIALFMRCGGRRDNIWPHVTGVIFLVEVDGLSTICPSSDTGACFIIASYSRPYGVTHPTERWDLYGDVLWKHLVFVSMICWKTQHGPDAAALYVGVFEKLFANILWKCQFALSVNYSACFIFTIAAESLAVFDIKHHIWWVVSASAVAFRRCLRKIC